MRGGIGNFKEKERVREKEREKREKVRYFTANRGMFLPTFLSD